MPPKAHACRPETCTCPAHAALHFNVATGEHVCSEFGCHRKVAIVGEAPSRVAAALFDGRSGRRLAKILGSRSYGQIRTLNLNHDVPDRVGKGYGFDVGVARVWRNHAFFIHEERVVLLGKRVARAFGIDTYLRWTHVPRQPDRPIADQVLAVAIPHPSGIVRWWNELDAERKVEECLAPVRELLGRGT